MAVEDRFVPCLRYDGQQCGIFAHNGKGNLTRMFHYECVVADAAQSDTDLPAEIIEAFGGTVWPEGDVR